MPLQRRCPPCALSVLLAPSALRGAGVDALAASLPGVCLFSSVQVSSLVFLSHLFGEFLVNSM